MTSILGAIERCNLALACAALAALFLLGLAEVILRPLGLSLPFATEYSGYLTGFAFLLGLGPALGAGTHVRLKLLGETPPLAMTVLAIIVSAVTAFAVSRWAVSSAVLDARSYFASETPLWVPQAVCAWGLWGLCLSLLRSRG